MISLGISILILILGYIFYGKVIARIFNPDSRTTPAISHEDGVDHTPLKKGKSFLIQLLNIAGTGPIFGALMGAVFGPVVFIWITLGTILGGAVHDYLSGMISCRNEGKSIAELSGKYIVTPVKYVMRGLIVVLLILTGTVFVTSPATLLAKLTPSSLNVTFWIIIIFTYYLLATILPINTIIGKIYPFFGAFLIVMVLLVLGGMIFNPSVTIPELTLENLHPDNLPVWPFMFVTVACGAISGFHATQSPIVAKCIRTEKDGKGVFMGAMYIEAIIALIWAAAGVAFYGATHALNDALSSFGQSGVVYDICKGLLGPFGGVIAIIGIIICPITSGDTAFRSVRLILGESFHIDQKRIGNRLLISIPLFTIAIILSTTDFDILWRYFSWCNQSIAMVSLWVSSVYLLKTAKHRLYSLFTAIPASFMSMVCLSYILCAKEGFNLDYLASTISGIVFGIILLCAFIVHIVNKEHLRKVEA